VPEAGGVRSAAAGCPPLCESNAPRHLAAFAAAAGSGGHAVVDPLNAAARATRLAAEARGWGDETTAQAHDATAAEISATAAAASKAHFMRRSAASSAAGSAAGE